LDKTINVYAEEEEKGVQTKKVEVKEESCKMTLVNEAISTEAKSERSMPIQKSTASNTIRRTGFLISCEVVNEQGKFFKED